MPHDSSVKAEFQSRICAHGDALGAKEAFPLSEFDFVGYRPDLTLEVRPGVTGLMFSGERRVLYHEHGCWSRNYNYSFDELIDLGQRYGVPFDLSQGDAVALLNGFLLACRASEEDKLCQEAGNRRWSDASSSSVASFKPNED